MAAFPPGVLDEIRASVDLVDLIGRYVTLKRAGQNWKGLCPFHTERTPSFMVNPHKGIFHCFGCGVGGDAFGFLMRQDRLSFPEAVRTLAGMVGIRLPEEPGPRDDAGRHELFRVMELAARFYSDTLWGRAGAQARSYLAARGIEAEVARRFGLGYAPEGWEHLLAAMRAAGVEVGLLETVGLIVAREGGRGHYDRFRGRLMFPIRDVQGRVVAFGGRTLGAEEPKYLNSPETPLYTKGRLLYGLDLARPAFRERQRALLVEGYVDCLMAHQFGFTETVATLGTALTPEQLALLRRYCHEVVTFFDADTAGQRAAERAAELLEPAPGGLAWAVNRSGTLGAEVPFKVRVALLPAGHDPDTFLRQHGAEALRARIEAARSLLAYALDRIMADAEGERGGRGRATAFARVALTLAKVEDAEEALALSREAAARLGADPAQLWIEAQRLHATLRKPTPPAAPAPPTGRAEDRALVRLMLHSPEARAELLPLIDERELVPAPLGAIVGALRRRPDAAGPSLLSDLDESARNELAALLMDDDREPGDPRASIADFRRRLELSQRLRRLRELRRALAAPREGDGGELLTEQLRLLDREGREARARVLGAAMYTPAPAGSPRSPEA
jgi:DNA primase